MQIYNSLTREKSEFIPIEANKVKMYVCGMTIYDYCHIGHARMLMTFDMVARYFRVSGYEVTFVRNITDIDDKIIARAKENSETIEQLTTRFTDYMHEDLRSLNVSPPDIEPRATAHIPQIIEMIQLLIDKGHAYQSASGDVLYEVATFPSYGKLTNQKLDELQAGQRIAVDTSKRHPYDFVLWKTSKPGEPFWPSPWGNGRPGWHIECSAMCRTTLGDKFDIHGGGLDLKFPHHEGEIAQSEPICGERHVNYWMHNGFVNVDNEKMSKSLGNFFTIRDVLAKFPGEVIRFFLLGTHYRSPLNYSDTSLSDAKSALERLYTALRGIETETVENRQLRLDYPDFFAAMDDDFNSAKAISELFTIARQLNKSDSDGERKKIASALKSLGNILGILQDDPERFLHGDSDGSDHTAIEILMTQRNQARQNKDWQKADAIRDQLNNMGVEIEDAGGETTWRLR
ncbi:MAG: cysteine--tRNA ligase [Gammaproteobacteria bacterium]|nr:MAG: cysteine--tRNA ligase [Gammaproteobacteria bacterium]